MVRNPQTPQSDENTLEQILDHVRRIDRRDRVRTIGGTIRSVINLIPTLIFLWFVWYVYAHGTDLIKQITTQTVTSGQQGFVNQLEQYFK